MWTPMDVTHWEKVHSESRGKREKWWLRDSTQLWLRKAPRDSRPYEPAIELLAIHLADAARVNTVSACPCVWSDAGKECRGIIVQDFADRKAERVAQGGEVLQRQTQAYDPENKWAQTPQASRESLLQFGTERGVDLATPFAHMLAFDVWIGNGDRHQENWAVLEPDPPDGDSTPRFAPMFDPAACLGAELGDGHKMLKPGADLAKYMHACPSGFGDGNHGIPLSEVFKQLRAWPEWTNNVRPWLAAFEQSMNTAKRRLEETPPSWLPKPRKDLAGRLLTARLDWMKGFAP